MLNTVLNESVKISQTVQKKNSFVARDVVSKARVHSGIRKYIVFALSK